MRVDTGAKFATIVFLLVSIVAGGIYLWQNRKSLLTPFADRVVTDARRIPNPSPATKTQLTQFADANSNIMGINVIRVDFQNNRRNTTFRYFKEEEVTTEWEAFIKSGEKVPLFGDNESSNQRLVSLINGQFVCVRTLDTSAGRVIPSVNQYSLATCMAPIPPGYGDFVGFINVFLRAQPTGAEILRLESQTAELSIDFYQRDIVKSTRSFTEQLR